MREASAREKDIAYPPLPGASYRETQVKPLLAEGCYFLAFGQIDRASTVGTLRVTSEAGQLFVSGDLYDNSPDAAAPEVGRLPPPGAGIPIFAMGNYSHYVRATTVEPADGGGFILTFDAHLFIAQVHQPLDGSLASHWRFEATYTAHMLPAETPPGYLRPDLFFVGDVARADGSMIGRMQIGWVAPALRRALVEIDRVVGCEAPEDNGAGVSWKSVFDPIGWDVTTVVGKDVVTKQNDSPWTEHDAREALATHRDRDDLDIQWRYHILVVPLMAPVNSNFGFMYDRDLRPREDLYVSSHFVFPDEQKWGSLRGSRTGQTVAFFRTAMHEMGHEMGLSHNLRGFCFMRPTEEIAAQAPAEQPFPSNIVWSFDPADELRLRHWPDIAVRPGGIDMGRAQPATD
jgi:hypothetical protein